MTLIQFTLFIKLPVVSKQWVSNTLVIITIKVITVIIVFMNT